MKIIYFFIFNFIIKNIKLDENEHYLLFENVLFFILCGILNTIISFLAIIFFSNQINFYIQLIISFSIHFLYFFRFLYFFNLKIINNKILWKNYTIKNLALPFIELFSYIFRIFNLAFRFYSNFFSSHLNIKLLLIFSVIFSINIYFHIKNYYLFLINISLLFFIFFIVISFLDSILNLIQYYIYIILNFLFYKDNY